MFTKYKFSNRTNCISRTPGSNNSARTIWLLSICSDSKLDLTKFKACMNVDDVAYRWLGLSKWPRSWSLRFISLGGRKCVGLNAFCFFGCDASTFFSFFSISSCFDCSCDCFAFNSTSRLAGSNASDSGSVNWLLLLLLLLVLLLLLSWIPAVTFAISSSTSTIFAFVPWKPWIFPFNCFFSALIFFVFFPYCSYLACTRWSNFAETVLSMNAVISLRFASSASIFRIKATCKNDHNSTWAWRRPVPVASITATYARAFPHNPFVALKSIVVFDIVEYGMPNKWISIASMMIRNVSARAAESFPISWKRTLLSLNDLLYKSIVISSLSTPFGNVRRKARRELYTWHVRVIQKLPLPNMSR